MPGESYTDKLWINYKQTTERHRIGQELEGLILLTYTKERGP